MMLVYDMGFISVFAVFVLLYVHAWRDDLELNAAERTQTIERPGANICFVGIGVLSLAMLLIRRVLHVDGEAKAREARGGGVMPGDDGRTSCDRTPVAGTADSSAFSWPHRCALRNAPTGFARRSSTKSMSLRFRPRATFAESRRASTT